MMYPKQQDSQTPYLLLWDQQFAVFQSYYHSWSIIYSDNDKGYKDCKLQTLDCNAENNLYFIDCSFDFSLIHWAVKVFYNKAMQFKKILYNLYLSWQSDRKASIIILKKQSENITEHLEEQTNF